MIECFSSTGFKFKDIMDNLLFTEAYMKDFYNLNIDHILTYFNNIDHCFVESIKYLPLYDCTYSFDIWFIKNKDI